VTDNIIFGVYKRSEDGLKFTKMFELPEFYVKRITDEHRSMKKTIPYFPTPYSFRLGSEGRTVNVTGHLGDLSNPFLHQFYIIMDVIKVGKYLRVESVTTNFPEMTVGTMWLIDGMSTERDGKIASFLYITFSLFGVYNKQTGGWIW